MFDLIFSSLERVRKSPNVVEQLTLHPGGVRGPGLPPGLPGGGVRGHPGALPRILLHGRLGRVRQAWLGLHETKQQICVSFVNI